MEPPAPLWGSPTWPRRGIAGSLGTATCRRSLRTHCSPRCLAWDDSQGSKSFLLPYALRARLATPCLSLPTLRPGKLWVAVLNACPMAEAGVPLLPIPPGHPTWCNVPPFTARLLCGTKSREGGDRVSLPDLHPSRPQLPVLPQA